jgi:hypothetical protein
MEWNTYLQSVAKGKISVNDLLTNESLSTEEFNALFAVFPTEHDDLSFSKASKKLNKVSSTLKTQFDSIYKKFGIEPPDKKELSKRLKIGFDKLIQEELKQQRIDKQYQSKSSNSVTAEGSIKPMVINSVAGDLIIGDKVLGNKIESKIVSIDWSGVSRRLLEDQKYLTTNLLRLGAARNIDDVHVPLGLIKPKDRRRMNGEPSPEQGFPRYAAENVEKEYEHELFLSEVVGNRSRDKHIAIIGEPGAGKTTLLTKIGEWLIEQSLEPLAVAWISLADLGDRSLHKYLREKWLEDVRESSNEDDWKSWKLLRDQGQTWLLLDGLDEMAGEAFYKIQSDLRGDWAINIRVVMTCRINQWETNNHNLVNYFEVYHTLDYSYGSAQSGEDQVRAFFGKWFGDAQVTDQIRAELDVAGRERIKNLVKNSLRLTLFCAAWEESNQAFPETQADLYQGFVNFLYKWNKRKFKKAVAIRSALDRSLGTLAKVGLNRISQNDGVVRRFRFTETEIIEIWNEQFDELLSASKDLEWLRVVGQENGNDIYSFLHPTFQEYFAACSIDDWDYFLPKAHEGFPISCLSESNPTYRLFERQWQQTLLLWIGRRNIDFMSKEDFIESMTNFVDDCNGFYSLRAYFMAGICISEFKEFQSSEVVVSNIAALAFGSFDIDEQQWRSIISPISEPANDVLYLTHKKYSIKILEDFLKQSNLDCYVCCEVAKTLGELDINNKICIELLLKQLAESEDNDDAYSDICSVLAKIGIGNEAVIEVIINDFALVLNAPILNTEKCSTIYSTLSDIAIGNKEAVFSLIYLLKETGHDMESYCYIAVIIESIVDDNDGQVIIDLFNILKQPNLSDEHCGSVFMVLEKILIGTRKSDVLESLLNEICQTESQYLSIAIIKELLKLDAVGNTIQILVNLINYSNLKYDNFNSILEIINQLSSNDKREIIRLSEYSLDKCEVSVLRWRIILKKISPEHQSSDNKTMNEIIDVLDENTNRTISPNIPGKLDSISLVEQVILDSPVDIQRMSIAELMKVLKEPVLELSYSQLVYYIHQAIQDLQETTIKNRDKISRLIELLQYLDIGDGPHVIVRLALENTSIGSKEAISPWVNLLSQKSFDKEDVKYIKSRISEIALGVLEELPVLVEALSYPELDDLEIYKVGERIGLIGNGNMAAISELACILKQVNLSDDHRSRISRIILKIVDGNKAAISSLLTLLERKDLTNDTRSLLMQKVSEISIIDEDNITSLIEALKTAISCGFWANKAAWELEKIAIGNQIVISHLIEILLHKSFDESFLWNLNFTLNKIITKPALPSIIHQLKRCIDNETNDFSHKKFEFVYGIIVKSSNTITYQEFYAAWHSPTNSVIIHHISQDL